MSSVDEFAYDPADEAFPDRAFEIYRTLRDVHPVYHSAARESWVLSRYEDVKAAAADTDTFSSEQTSISTGLRPMIQQMDPPRHDAVRNLLWKAMTPRRVAAMEPRVRELARGLIGAFLDRGEGDLLHDFASQLPSLVIGELIGIPPERRAAFLGWTEALITANPAVEWEANPFEAIYGEFADLLAMRRRERQADLMSALIDAELDGKKLDEDELLGFCFLLVVGGNDTTTNLIANGAVLLARHPDQRRELTDDPSLIPGAVEEMLRYDSPTQALPRRATRDVSLHGVQIEKGEEVSLLWGAANHDDRRFKEPERFDIHRASNHHLALGHGIHFCMGSHLARLEGRVAVDELLRALPDFTLQTEPVWQPSAWARAYKSVPVEFGSPA
ncbi:MAG: cytochrome P450 [Myxococcota bacterium]|nr:cytochrome P450 [Myxococcota bacterium]